MATWRRRNGQFQVRWKELEVVELEGGAVAKRWVCRSRTVPDQETAKRLARDVERLTAIGERWTPATEIARPTVDAVFGAYLDDRMRVLRQSTIECYAIDLDVALRFYRERRPTGPLFVDDMLTRPMLVDLHAWLLRTGHHRPRGARSAKKIVEVVQLAWAWAADDDRYAEAVPRPRTIEMPKGDRTPTVAPTWGEMDACVAAAEGWQRQLAIVLRYTGLRVGQVMRLAWSDVDLDRATITIRGELGKSDHEREGRIVPGSAHLVAELAGWGVREGWLVPSDRREGPRQREARGRDMARAWRRAGVAEDRWKGHPDHAFRKGVTSELNRAGADREAVEHLLGHARPSVRGAYLDPDFMPMREAVALIPRIGDAPAAVKRMRSSS